MEPTSSKYKVGTLIYDAYYGLGFISQVHAISGGIYEYSIELFSDDRECLDTFSYLPERAIYKLVSSLQSFLKGA